MGGVCFSDEGGGEGGFLFKWGALVLMGCFSKKIAGWERCPPYFCDMNGKLLKKFS